MPIGYILGFLPGHRSGSIRGEALRILGTDPSDFIIPFAVIRLVDWVREVRREAEAAVRKELDAKWPTITATITLG